MNEFCSNILREYFIFCTKRVGTLLTNDGWMDGWMPFDFKERVTARVLKEHNAKNGQWQIWIHGYILRSGMDLSQLLHNCLIAII